MKKGYTRLTIVAVLFSLIILSSFGLILKIYYYPPHEEINQLDKYVVFVWHTEPDLRYNPESRPLGGTWSIVEYKNGTYNFSSTDGVYGVQEIMDIFDKYDAKCTFVLTEPVLLNKTDVVKQIVNRKFGVGVHVHPQYTCGVNPNEEYWHMLKLLTKDEQYELIKLHFDLLERLSPPNTPICSFVAGNWATNKDTFDVLQRIGRESECKMLDIGEIFAFDGDHVEESIRKKRDNVYQISVSDDSENIVLEGMDYLIGTNYGTDDTWFNKRTYEELENYCKNRFAKSVGVGDKICVVQFHGHNFDWDPNLNAGVEGSHRLPHEEQVKNMEIFLKWCKENNIKVVTIYDAFDAWQENK